MSRTKSTLANAPKTKARNNKRRESQSKRRCWTARWCSVCGSAVLGDGLALGSVGFTMRFLLLPSFVLQTLAAYGIATAAASAPAWATCAIATMFFQTLLPSTARSGTTMVSPGPTEAESTPPDQPPLPPLVTAPLARMMKMAFLLASCVAPPECDKYHPEVFPGV